jgi:O-antigen/teichoic acid export membrane protein
MMSDSLREDQIVAQRHFRKSRRLLLIVSAGVSVGFIIFSHPFVTFVLGPKYAMAGWMMQLLGVRGALELFMSVAVSMLFALGTSKYAATGNIYKLIFLGAGFAVAFGWFGFYTAVWVLTIAPLANYIPLLFGLKRYCRPVLRAELASFAVFAAITGIAAIIAGVFSHLNGF